MYQYYNAISPLSEADWLQFEAFAKPVSFKKGDVLFSAGEHVNNAFGVRSGIIKVSYNTEDGKEFIKAFQIPCHLVIPYMEGINGEPSNITATAITDIEVLLFPFDKVLETLQSTPNLQTLHNKILQSLFTIKDKREHQFLTMAAAARYQVFLDEYSAYETQIPNQLIAAYLGITPVSLSRLRAQNSIK